MDGNIPLVTGDVPVEFVVVIEESNRVEDSIMEQNGFRSVLCARHPAFKFQVAAIAFLFVFQRHAVVIGDGERFEKQGVVEMLRRVVFDGDCAVEAVPRTGEMRFDNFGYFDCAVGAYGDGFFKMLDGEFAGIKRQRGDERCEECEQSEGESKAIAGATWDLRG